MGVCASTTKSQIRVISGGSLVGSDKVRPFPFKSAHGQNGSNSNGTCHPFNKKESELNLLPPEQRKMQSDERVFEREKRMVVLLAVNNDSGASQLAVIDADFQSKDYGKVINYLTLPGTGDELYHFACMRTTHSSTRLFTSQIETVEEAFSDNSRTTSNSLTVSSNNFTLVVPAPNTSRIYITSVLLDISSEIPVQMRIQKCITSEELARWDLASPLAVSTNNAGRSQGGVPLLICACTDKNRHTKGDLLRLDRRTFVPVSRKRSMSNGDSISKSSTVSPNASPPIVGSPIAAGLSQFPQFGGSVAVHVRQGVLFSTEWGDLAQIFTKMPRIQNGIIEEGQGHSAAYGHSVNIWELQQRRLRQTLRLDPVDGKWTICVRMLHHCELTHGFVCSAIGSSIFHLHKSTKTGLFSADRVIKFSTVRVEEWPGDVPDVPAFCTDMCISMDDQFLYVCAAFHGFIAQFQISDPFRPTLSQKIFLGGIVHKFLGDLLPDECNEHTESSQRVFNIRQCKVGGKVFEGGPSRLQLSLDGRRLFVSNSFLRNWDERFYPQVTEKGSSIALIHIDVNKGGTMTLDEKFCVRFESASNGERNGTYCAREMRFLNGDSTSDFV